MPYAVWGLLKHPGLLAALVVIVAVGSMACGVLVTGALWAALRWLTRPSATVRRLRKEGEL